MTSPTLADLHQEANWLEWRSRVDAFPALKRSRMVTTEQTRAEFLEGARLLRLDHKVRAGDGGRGPSPVQLAIADILNAGAFLNGIMEPRRTTKTTSVQAVMLGRCTMRDDYQAGWTMLTTGAKVSERFRKDIVVNIERLYPNAKSRPMVVNVGKGSEHLAWPNGSFLNVYTPNGDGWRSGGFDFAFADEGGEAEPDVSEDITIAVIPTMDTKPGAQFVVAGTGASYREGNLLWDTLNDPKAAVIWHGIPETTDPAQLEAWEPSPEHPQARMRELIELSHPGVTYTTPIEAVERSFDKFPREKFLREYGGMFGLDGAADTLIPPAWWERAGIDGGMPEPPERFVAALKVHHNGTAASLAVAWDYEEPSDLVTDALALDGLTDTRPARRAIALWHWQADTVGLKQETLTRLRRRRAPLVYDNYGNTRLIGEELDRTRPKPELHPTKPADIPLGAVELLQGLEAGTIVHFRQPILDRAAQIAVRQSFGQYGSWRIGPPKTDGTADVTSLEAASLALRGLAEHRPAPYVAPEKALDFFA